MTRDEMFHKSGAVPLVDSILGRQYREEEESYWRRDVEENERSAGWHLSFHASAFPVNGKSCARRALYTMMGIPEAEPFSRKLRSIMDAGLDIENQVARRLEASNLLLSGHGKKQTSFALRKYWLNGNIDFVIRKPGVNAIHVVECKTKKLVDIEAMKKGDRQHDEAHYGQLQCYIYGVRKGQQMGKIFTNYPVCDSGTIIYLARDDPSYTHEFYFDFNEALVEAALAKLLTWKQSYLNGELLPRPRTYQWSKHPCQYCPMKKSCKEDDKNGVSLLSESAAIPFAKSVHAKYDYSTIRQAVLDRWS